ncbi:hypothetical protein SO802_012291 [Lithocarpus litseifolius]|uniref:Uncharacterized protein n=1 Tax=Lithocarpus litseifolius TaxID=425828 RepID=A0AAW2D5V8_9ROSI
MIKKLFSLSSDRSSGCDSGSSSRDDSPPLDIPGVDMDVVYKKLRERLVSGSSASLSITLAVPPIVSPTSQEVDDEMVCCDVRVSSSIDADRLSFFRDRYQFPDDVCTCLVAPDEWCCSLRSLSIDIYESFLLPGLRFPWNAFTRESSIGRGYLSHVYFDLAMSVFLP